MLGRHPDVFSSPLWMLFSRIAIASCPPLDDHPLHLGIDRSPSCCAACASVTAKERQHVFKEGQFVSSGAGHTDRHRVRAGNFVGAKGGVWIYAQQRQDDYAMDWGQSAYSEKLVERSKLPKRSSSHSTRERIKCCSESNDVDGGTTGNVARRQPILLAPTLDGNDGGARSSDLTRIDRRWRRQSLGCRHAQGVPRRPIQIGHTIPASSRCRDPRFPEFRQSQ